MKIEFLIVGVIVLIVVLTFFGAKEKHEQEKAFMAECRLYHKQYECDMKWAVASGKAQSEVASSAFAGGLIGGMIAR